MQLNYSTEIYQYDGSTAATAYNLLNQMRCFQRGTVNGYGAGNRPNSIAGTERSDQTWSLVSGDTWVDRKRTSSEPAVRYDGREVQQRGIPDDGTSSGNSLSSDTPMLFVRFDAWGQLGRYQTANRHVYTTRSDGMYPTYTTHTEYQNRQSTYFAYDALGRRISETNDLYFDAAGNIIEERTPAGTVSAQYVYSADGGGVVFRERDNDSNPATLEERLYPITDAQGSTTSIFDNAGTWVESYVYTPEGERWVWGPEFVPASNSPYRTPEGSYDWRPAYKGGRYDGSSLFYLNGKEMDSTAGGPLVEDGNAYWDARNAVAMERIRNSEVSNVDPYHIARISGLIGTALLTIASGGTYLTVEGALAFSLTRGLAVTAGFAAAGAAGGAAVGACRGENVGAWAAGGAELGMGVAGLWGPGLAKGGAGWACRMGTAGLGAMKGAAIGAAYGGVQGFAQGFAHTNSFAGAWEYAKDGAFYGAVGGAIFGGLYGALNPRICFIAGTQVVVGIEEADSGDEGSPGERFDAAGGVTTTRKLRYVTKNIEDIAVGDLVVSRDQNDAAGPLVLSRVDRTYRRVADHLRILTIRSSSGDVQTLYTTDDHPYYAVGRGWCKARDLVVGDALVEPDGSSSLLMESVREDHPEGVPVFNFRVEEAHSYFVREQYSTAEPVWVHNAEYAMVPDAMAPKYKKGWAGDVVGDHRLSRAIGKVLGVDADVAANIVQKGYATNARKGGIEGHWLKSYKSYVDGGLSPEQALEVLRPEIKALVRDAWPLVRPNSQLDRIPVYATEPAI